MTAAGGGPASLQNLAIKHGRAASMSGQDTRPKRREFAINVRFNNQLGNLETFSMFAEGLGGVLYIAGTFLGQLPVAGLGSLLVLLAIFALLAHLGTPLRFWQAWRNAASSMASRGVIAMGGFMCTSLGWIAGKLLDLPAPWQTALLAASWLSAVVVVAYGGLLLRSIRAIGLWRGPYVVTAFPAHSIASAAVVLPLMTRAEPQNIEVAQWLVAAMVALLACSALSLVHLLAAGPTAGVRASVNRILNGDLRTLFFGGACLIGILMPLICLAGVHLWSGGVADGPLWTLLAVAGTCRLVGDYAYKRVIVRTGAYEPILG